MLALVCAGWPARGRLTVAAGWLASSGGLIFAIALSFVGLLNLPFMGAVAPIGGLLMIAGWLFFALAVLRSRSINA